MKTIQLTQGMSTIVDDADFEWLNQWKWHYSSPGYAQRNLSMKPRHIMVSMHTVIMKTPKGLEVDHKNRNKLDNRRANLRNVTHSVNNLNKPKQSNNTSGHKGIYWAGWTNMWRVLIEVDGVRHHLGYYKEIADAKKARVNYEKENGLCI